MSEFISELLQAIIAVAVPIITGFVVRFLGVRAKNSKNTARSETARRYVCEAVDAASTAVLYVSQTYVDTLKAEGSFSPENHANAFRKAKSLACDLLTAEAKRFLGEAYGTLDNYLTAQIEAQIKLQKDGVYTLAQGYADAGNSQG